MKGLFIKDLSIIGQQKKFGIMFILLALFFSFSMETTFVVAYMPILAMTMAFGTISYDSFDNGMSFLMSLPGSRKNYAKEKLIFNIIIIAASWVLGCCLQMVALTIKKESFVLSDVILMDIACLAVVIIMNSITLPIILKYGNEKGRIILFALFGIVALCAITGKDILKYLNRVLDFDVNKLIAKITKIPEIEIVLVMMVVCVIFSFISYMISNRIVRKQEF